MAKRRRGSPVRWRLLLLTISAILLLAAGALIRIGLTEVRQRQDRVIPTLMVVTLTCAVLLLWSQVWLLFLSRLRWKSRLLASGAVAILIGLTAASIEIRGVSGDIVPVLGWRWAVRPDLPVPASSGRQVPGPEVVHDYPQFLGSKRNGVVTGVRLSRDWTESPGLLWRQPIGEGWSGFAVADGLAVTQEQRGEEERVSGYDLLTGRLVWSHADRARWEDPIGGAGPRATPAIDRGRVYTLGGTGILNALELDTGAVVWARNVVEDHDSGRPVYGVSASPLVIDGRVIVALGGGEGRALVAYEAETGEPVWAKGSGGPGYSSPMPAVLAGRSQIVLLNGSSLAGHDRDSGDVLWQYPWPAGTENVSQPVELPGDRVFLSTGYGVGAKLFGVRREADGGWAVDLLWESLGLRAKFTNVVHSKGFLYGLDDGILVCLDPSDGSRRWKRGRYGHGQVILVDDLLLVLGEKGRVALVETSPEAYRELAGFQALSGKTWNHPALAGRYLLVRNDREAACYELPLAG